MQSSNRTVIFGEAPEESDSEEIELNDERRHSTSERQQQHRPTYSQSGSHTKHVQELDLNDNQQQTTRGQSGILGTSLFASIADGASSSTLAKLAKYSPYELLSSSIGQPKLITTVGKNDRLSTETIDSQVTPSFDGNNTNQLNKQALQQLPPLHRSLCAKNYQFRASMDHLHKHPLQVASKNVHSMSQCLVHNQKIIQELNSAMIKIQRELKNLDIDITSIV